MTTPSMPRRGVQRPWLAAAWLLAASSSAWAAQREAVVSAARQSRQEMRQLKAVQPPDAPPPEPRHTLTLGLLRDEAPGDASVTALPFAYTYQSRGSGGLQWSLEGSVCERQCAEQACASGLSDLALAVARQLGGGFSGRLAVSVPSGGPVGSSAAAQQVSLQHAFAPAAAWSLTSMVRLTRLNAPAPGTSRYATVLAGGLNYVPAQDWTVFGTVARSGHAGNVPALVTELTAGLAFPLALGTGGPATEGALSLTRGLTAGARHTAIQFDLSVSF